MQSKSTVLANDTGLNDVRVDPGSSPRAHERTRQQNLPVRVIATLLQEVVVNRLTFVTALWLVYVVTAFSQNGQTTSTPQTVSPASQRDWHITWVPAYLWLTGVNGNLGFLGKTIPIDAPFSDVFDKLNIGYMTAFDIRRKRLGVLTDFQYVDLSSDEISTPFGKFYSSAHTDAQQYILDPEIYSRAIDTPRVSVDVLAGIRYWHLRMNLGLRPGLLPAFNGSDSRDWVDPVMGARFHVNLKKGWFAMLKGDAGGFGAGSQQTWQIYTGGGKEFKQRVSLFLGYRRLSVNYRDGGFIYDVNMNGMLLGCGIKFK